MNRLILIVTGCALLVSLAAWTVAAMLGPLSYGDSNNAFDLFNRGPSSRGGGPMTTRTLPWSGGDELNVHLPATVNYTQGPVARLEIRGPERTLNRIEVDGDAISFDGRVRDAGDVTITLTAPDVRSFGMYGAQELTITGYDQDRLEISVHGAGEVKADGRAREVELAIHGAGEADLGGVAAETVEVSIYGAGEATVSPRQRVDVTIMGAGEVDLTTRPAQVNTNIMGAGEVNQPDADDLPSPPPVPAPPPVPPGPRTAT